MFFDVFWQLFAKKSCKRLSVREKKNKKFLCKLNFCSFFERILAFAGIVEGSNCFSNIQHQTRNIQILLPQVCNLWFCKVIGFTELYKQKSSTIF
jgi:hypothetical protein